MRKNEGLWQRACVISEEPVERHGIDSDRLGHEDVGALAIRAIID